MPEMIPSYENSLQHAGLLLKEEEYSSLTSAGTQGTVCSRT